MSLYLPCCLLGIIAANIAISFLVTIPFLQRHNRVTPVFSLRLTNWIAPYFDVIEAFKIAISGEAVVKLPLLIYVQALLLALQLLLLILLLTLAADVSHAP